MKALSGAVKYATDSIFAFYLLYIIHTIMNPLNEFVEEDSEVEGEFSIIINSESDSDSGPDEETPSDLDSSDLDPSDLGPSDSSASKEAPKLGKGSHFHSILGHEC